MGKYRELTVLDLFCGAGGFSEGFRQQGYSILHGIDNSEAAIATFNYNFNLQCKPKNIIDIGSSLEKINELPNTDVIIGSPPCVSFSNSNRSGTTDKTLGLELIQTFFRIIAIKKFQENSVLKAWLMENVPKSTGYISKQYTFQDLDLTCWAIARNINPSDTALKIGENTQIINAVNYGTPQNRKRAFTGEIISKSGILLPPITHSDESDPIYAKSISLKSIISKLPKPNCKKIAHEIQDPLYPTIKLKLNDLTDHFYDSGVYQWQWEEARYKKINHPFMGKMSFPENHDKPSRTITATNFTSSRESIVLKSEYKRIGNGEYRSLTVREKACLMGFPITYQFLGNGESSKLKLVGNAVCPQVSMAFAKLIKDILKYPEIELPQVVVNKINKKIVNLNTFTEKDFDFPINRKKGARFRRHPFKDGSMTVSLTNYDISKKTKSTKWMVSVQYGYGESYLNKRYNRGYYKEIEIILREMNNGSAFIDALDSKIVKWIGNARDLQDMHEKRRSINGYLNPTQLIDKLAMLIREYDKIGNKFYQTNKKIFHFKEIVPTSQLFALYAINKIVTGVYD